MAGHKSAEFWLEEIWHKLGGAVSGLVLGPSESHIGTVGGHVFAVKGEFTRPTDTAPYAANDAVMNSTSAPVVITFTNVARVAATGVTIMTCKLCKSTNVTTNANFRLWIYSNTPASIPNDNAAWLQAWANRDLRVGWVDFTNPIAGSDCVTYQGVLSMAGPDPIIPTARNLYGILQATSAYVPGNAEIFSIFIRGYAE